MNARSAAAFGESAGRLKGDVDRLAHFGPSWPIRTENPSDHGFTEITNLLWLAVQATKGKHHFTPPTLDPVAPLERLAFGLRDQGRELHVGVDKREEPIDVAG